jgi:hypothetical protein
MTGEIINLQSVGDSQAEAGDEEYKQPVVRAHGDIVADEALGRNLPKGYYYSRNFIGTLLVSS